MISIKKIIKILLITILTIFSFYYANASIGLIRKQDPIMQQIESKKDKYNISPINAKIIDDKIIPGKQGQEIDYETSYTKMKQYGAYNELLTTMKETKPDISIDNYYDKYVISGNTSKKSVALIFKVEEEFPDKILAILEKEKVKATLFIDGLFLEKHYQDLAAIKTHQLELLSYNNTYDKQSFKISKNFLESLTNKPSKYCYSDSENEKLLSLCQSLNMHTIIPTIRLSTSPYQELKENLTNSAIIYVPSTKKSLKELSTIIEYIKSRGYTFETLENLLSE